MYFARRMFYYLTSLSTLWRGVRNRTALLMLVRPRRAPTKLVLRNGTSYLVNSLMDAWIVKETNLDHQYEQFGVTIKDGWSVADIGAGIGDFTVFAAQLTPAGRVTAYEPDPESAAVLRQNLALNGIRNVDVSQSAVASVPGRINLDTSGGVAVQYQTAGAGKRSATGTITVPAVTLASVLNSLPNNICDFLKMDCEGAEYDILLNADEATLLGIKRLCLEYHDHVTKHSHADLVNFFRSRGWKAVVHPSPVREDLGFLYAEAPCASGNLGRIEDARPRR
jgi:FkbM family methyltransferase